MQPNLSRYLNRTLLVSIPTLFEDGYCRPYTLLGVELNGLWLKSDDLTNRLLPDESRDSVDVEIAAAFVPFAQIAGVLVAANVPKAARRSARKRQDRDSQSAPTAETQRRTAAKTASPPPKQPPKKS